MIEEMYDIMINMKSQLSIMDNNIKLLQAKVNSEVFSGLRGGLPASHAVPHKQPEVQVPPPPDTAESASSQPQISIPPEPAQAYKGTMVHGKAFSEDGKPIHGVAIKIMNSDKKIIKETTTNRSGAWTAQLRPGKYIAKTVLDGKPAQFKLFEVVEGQTQQDV